MGGAGEGGKPFFKRVSSFPRSSPLLPAFLNKVFCPVRDGGGEEVRPAGEGAANEQAVAVRAVFFVHARARRQGEAAGRALIVGPFAAGVVEFVSAPHAAQRVEGILRNHAGRDVAEALRAAVETGTCRQKTGHGVLAVVEEQGAAEQQRAAQRTCVNDEGVRETGRPRCICRETGRPRCVGLQAFREGCRLIGRLRHRHRFAKRFKASRELKCQSSRRTRHILASQRSVLSHSPEILASDSKSLAMHRTAMLDHASCVVARDCFEMRNALDRKSCRAAADSRVAGDSI